jgi:hypothetical protein
MTVSDDGPEAHPFVIDMMLVDKFGYSNAFVIKELLWDFTTSSGGGRHKAAAIRDLMHDMADLTREGAALSERALLLETLFHHHYDAARIEFIYQFLFGDTVTMLLKLNKAHAIAFMVENHHHAPFIPFDILSEHQRTSRAQTWHVTRLTTRVFRNLATISYWRNLLDGIGISSMASFHAL